MKEREKSLFFLTFQMLPWVILVNCGYEPVSGYYAHLHGALVTKANRRATLAGLAGSAEHSVDLGHSPSLPLPIPSYLTFKKVILGTRR